ncbi:MAG: nitrophenyl compound nitroreductase subunit ArsF family protein [Oligosphaeraceae bacterium]
MTVVKVYGSGCEKCRQLYENAQMALDAAGVEADIEKVSDMEAMVAAGVLMTPALEIDGRIVCSGQVMAAKDILALLPVPDAESGCACACGCGKAKGDAASGGSCGCGGGSKAAPGGSCGCGGESKAASGGACCCGGGAVSPGKRLLRYVLLTFVGVAVAVMLVRESGGGQPSEASASGTAPASAVGSVSAEPSLTVYYFHGTMRCVTCGKFERLTREVLEGRFGAQMASGKVRLKVVNVEEAGNEHYASDYGLTTRSVVLVGASGFRRLDGIWEKIRESDAAFSEYVASNVSEMLEGR